MDETTGQEIASWIEVYIEIVEEYQREMEAAYDEYEKRANHAIMQLFERKLTLQGVLVEDGALQPGAPPPWETKAGELSVYRRMMLES